MFATRLKAVFTWLTEHFPFTFQGLVVLLAAAVGLRVFAYGRMDLVVFALAVCAIAIVCFSLLAVLLGGFVLRRTLHAKSVEYAVPVASDHNKQPVSMEAGYPNETGFRLPAMAWLPLISLDWQIVFPDAMDTRNRLDAKTQIWEENIIPARRCKTAQITRLYTISDVLGFCRFSWRVTHPQELLVLPQTGLVRNLPLLRSLTAEDGISSPVGDPQGDRMEIRPYVPGDSVRNIMWTVYARTRHLNVRLAEKSVHHSNRTYAYLLSGPSDEAAAAVARVAVESGALGEDWIFGADGSEETSSNVRTALTLIAGSRALGQPNAYGLDRFLQQVNAPANSHCIVFASARSGPWIKSLQGSVARFGGRFSVVLATDGLTNEQPNPWWRKILFLDDITTDAMGSSAKPHKGGAAVAQLSQLLIELGHFVESSVIVDRHTGLSFDQRLKRV